MWIRTHAARARPLAPETPGVALRADSRPPAPRPRARLGALAIGCLLVCTLVAGVGVPDASARDWGYDLGGELMSPFCPGRTLASCPSPQAAELVQWIVTQEAAGATREEVLEILVERYGEEILGAPPAKGIALWAYVLPVLGFLLFGGVAVLVLRRLTGGEADRLRPPLASAPAAAEAAPGLAAAAPVVAPPPTSEGAAPDEADLAAIVDAELARRA